MREAPSVAVVGKALAGPTDEVVLIPACRATRWLEIVLKSSDGAPRETLQLDFRTRTRGFLSIVRNSAGLTWAAAVLYFSAIISGFACGLAPINALARMLFSMGRYDFVHRSMGAPWGSKVQIHLGPPFIENLPKSAR
jgi:amino acid transporter